MRFMKGGTGDVHEVQALRQAHCRVSQSEAEEEADGKRQEWMTHIPAILSRRNNRYFCRIRRYTGDAKKRRALWM